MSKGVGVKGCQCQRGVNYSLTLPVHSSVVLVCGTGKQASSSTAQKILSVHAGSIEKELHHRYKHHYRCVLLKDSCGFLRPLVLSALVWKKGYTKLFLRTIFSGKGFITSDRVATQCHTIIRALRVAWLHRIAR